MIAYDPMPDNIERFALVAPGSLFAHSSPHSVRRVVTDLCRTIFQVEIGDTVYRLRRPLTLRFYPFVRNGMGELIREPDRPELEQPSERSEPLDDVGLGVTFPDAYRDWAGKLHVRIQTLLGKRPWEMTPDEQREMAFVERLVDLPAYHRETPIRTRQIGTVSRSRPLPDSVRWEDGTSEMVTLDQMPPEFAAYLGGQRFEAITLRDVNSGRLLRVTHVERLGHLAPTPADEWEKVPTSAVSPRVEWSEID